MRLENKFKNAFLYPLTFGMVLSIMISLFLIFAFTKIYSDPETISKFEILENNKINPAFQLVNNRLFEKFQKPIYSLFAIKKHYEYYSYILLNKEKNLSNINFHKQYSINAVDLAKYYSQIMNKISNKNVNNSEEILKYAYWFVDNKIDTFDKIDLINYYNPTYDTKNLKDELTILNNLHPILRSTYETSLTDSNGSYDAIYFASKGTSLFYGYPLDSRVDENNKGNFIENNTFFNNFNFIKNFNSCVDQDGKVPDYFFFECRDWWLQIIEENIFEENEQITISNPYKFTGSSKHGITVCIKFNNILNKNYNKNINKTLNDENLLASFCLDLDFTDIIKEFENVNKGLSGYFYILKTGTNFPVYYPYLDNTEQFSNLEKLEFDMTNPYYIKELVEYSNKIIPKLTLKIDYKNYTEILKNKSNEDNKKILKGTYLKYLRNYTYIINPVFFYDSSTNKYRRNHLLSIIYIFERSVIYDNLISLTSTLYPRLIIQLFIFSVVSLILLHVAWKLIINVSFNIVRPIKTLKFQINGVKGDHKNFDKNLSEKIELNKKMKNKEKKKNEIIEEEKTLDFSRSNSKLKKTFTKLTKRSFYKEYSHISEDSESEELEEDDIGIISNEMDDLFNTVINLKNVISFTVDRNNKYDPNALVKYLSSINTFGRINNSKAEKISESNLGSLLISYKKFNYSVLHLKKCLLNSQNANMQDITENEVFKSVKSKNLTNKFFNFINNKKNKFLDENNFDNIEKLTQKNNNSQVQNLENKNILEKIGKELKANEFIVPLKERATILFNNFKKNFKKDSIFKKSVFYGKNSMIFTPIDKVNDIHKPSFISDINFNKKNKTHTININKDIKEVNKNTLVKNEIKEENDINDEISDVYPIFNIKSRYPKLIFSFKNYFKNLRKLLKNKNFDKEKFKEDILILNKDFNLENYEKTILLYLEDSIKQMNVKRQAEAILEYIEFLIVYRIKLYKVMENSQINNNFNLFEYLNLNFKNEIENEKINLLESFKENLKKIKTFFEFFENLKKKIQYEINSEYYKNFLEIISEKRINDLDITEIPSTVMLMKYYYLKGKLANICGHLNKALEFFYKSREALTVCDALIITKSNKKIKKIYTKISKNFQYERYKLSEISSYEDFDYFESKYLKQNIFPNNLNTSSNLTTKNSLNHTKTNDFLQKIEHNRRKNIDTEYLKIKINKQIKTYDNLTNEITEKITQIDKEINSFKDYFKDVVILIDSTKLNSTDLKKYENLLKTCVGFYDNYVSFGDRFGLFLLNYTIVPVASFEKKQMQNYKYTKNILNYAVKDIFSFVSEMNSNYINVYKAILLSLDYINKKWNYENEKWIILFCFNFSNVDFEDSRLLIEKNNSIKNYINLIVIGIDLNQNSVKNVLEFLKLFAQKSVYIPYEDIGTLKNILKKKGIVEKKNYFPNEIYVPGKTNDMD